MKDPRHDEPVAARRRVCDALALASLLCAACATSHPTQDGPDRAADDLNHDDALPDAGGSQDGGGSSPYARRDAGDEDAAAAPAATHCGVPDPELPALLGVDGHEVWLQWLDGRRQRVHAFDAADPAFGPDVVPALWRAGEHVVVSVGGRFTAQGISAQARVLLKRSGELVWARSWPATEGGVLLELGLDGSLLLDDGHGNVWVRPDGTERHLPPGFIPLHTPDADGWFGGVFSDDTGAPPEYGFQHAETDEQRSVQRNPDNVRDIGNRNLIEGRFQYTFVDAAGVVGIGVEGPDSQTTLVLEGETVRPDLVRGPTHTLVIQGNRSVALFDNASLQLTPLEQLAADPRDMYLRADGEWFVAIVQPGLTEPDASHPFHVAPLERAYRVHAPTAQIDTTPLPALPGGMSHYEYSSCTWVTAGGSVDGRLGQALAPPGVPEPAPAQLFLESEDSQRWEPLGSPVIFGIDASADRVGDTWLLRTGDARNRYCAQRPTGTPLPDVLAGQTVQVVAPDGEALAFGTPADAIDELESTISLTIDGDCALITGQDGESRWHDLRTHEEHALDLPGAAWLYPFEPGYTGW